MPTKHVVQWAAQDLAAQAGYLPKVETNIFEMMKTFFVAWDGISSKKHENYQFERFKLFFELWGKSYNNRTLSKRLQQFDFVKYDNFFKNFAVHFSEYRRCGGAMNVWKAANLGHDEVRNCFVLAGFLNRFGDHGQESALLTGILYSLGQDKLAELVTNGKYRTKVEVLPLGDTESRVDIEIDCPGENGFLIFIEAKIRAPETVGQLERYVDLAKCKAGHRRWLLIYLTTNGRAPSIGNNENVCALSWTQVSKIIRVHFTKLDRNKANVVRDVMLQYSEYLTHLS